jgi:hypothetical protein
MSYQPRSRLWRWTIGLLPPWSLIRPLWLGAAGVLAIVLAPFGSSDSDNDAAFAVWIVFLVLAGVLAALALHPWATSIRRHGIEKGYTLYTLGRYTALRTMFPVVMPLGFLTWLVLRWDESDLPLQPFAHAMGSVCASLTVVALLGSAFAMFAGMRRRPGTDGRRRPTNLG